MKILMNVAGLFGNSLRASFAQTSSFMFAFLPGLTVFELSASSLGMSVNTSRYPKIHEAYTSPGKINNEEEADELEQVGFDDLGWSFPLERTRGA
jgi:hypothetical protein